MNANKIYGLILALAINVGLFGQVQNNQQIIEQIVESFAEGLGEDADLTSLIEELEDLQERPFNINSATRSDLEKLHFLSSFQIENLLMYRIEYGQLLSVFELQTIDGFDIETAKMLEYFVVFNANDVAYRSYFNQELNLRYDQNIEKAAGFIENENGLSSYKGISPKLLVKYKGVVGQKYSFGLTAENDCGEEFFKGSNPYGFDFYSAYFRYSGKKYLKQLVIGDFQIKTGQGLIQWSGYGKRKSVDAVNLRYTGQGIKSYSSSDENNFLRGFASSMEFGNFNLITFYSNSNIDANVIASDSSGNPIIISSLQQSGYHRTENETLDKRSVNSQTVGANLKYTKNRFLIGVNGVFNNYNALIQPSETLYKKFYFSGNNNYNLSTDFLWIRQKINLFGEAAISKSGGNALVTGIETKPANEISFSVLFRNFAKDFHSINGTSFGETTNNINEKGIYAGLLILPFSHFKLSAYLDNYETIWLKSTSNGLVKGNDLIFQADYIPSKNLSFYLRVKSEINSKKTVLSLPIKDDAKQQTSRVRLNMIWQLNEQINIRFRAEGSNYKYLDLSEYGWLVFSDFNYEPTNKIKINCRFAFYNTESYNTRIYAYENDVPLSFYIPAFYSHGIRYYFNFKYKINNNFTSYLKISQSRYLSKNEIFGSGASEITGNHRSNIKFHIKYRF